MKHMSALKKIIADCERQNKKQCIGLSFTIILEEPNSSISDPTHPDYCAPTFEETTYRTRGYQQPHESNHSQPSPIQTEETPNEPTT